MLTPRKEEALDCLKLLLHNIKGLPSHAWTCPITHYDFASALELIVFLLDKEENQESNDAE